MDCSIKLFLSIEPDNAPQEKSPSDGVHAFGELSNGEEKRNKDANWTLSTYEEAKPILRVSSAL